MFQLVKKIIIKGEIELLTGLHVGGTNAGLEIGGLDSYVVRDPIYNEPYIPGSSIKGKMRSLFEISQGALGASMGRNIQNGPSFDIDKKPARLFGTASNDEKQRPSRIIVRDAKLKNAHDLKKTELNLTEAKTEVVIDRITSRAMPRSIERVPAGAVFSLNIVINVIKHGDHDKSENNGAPEELTDTFNCLKLLQDDYLGGHGSRGSGQVNIRLTSIVQRSMDFYSSGKDDKKSQEIPEDLK